MGCKSGKTIFLSEYDAKSQLDNIAKRRATGDRRRRETRYYECGKCGFYHITSQRKREKDNSPSK